MAHGTLISKPTEPATDINTRPGNIPNATSKIAVVMPNNGPNPSNCAAVTAAPTMIAIEPNTSAKIGTRTRSVPPMAISPAPPSHTAKPVTSPALLAKWATVCGAPCQNANPPTTAAMTTCGVFGASPGTTATASSASELSNTMTRPKPSQSLAINAPPSVNAIAPTASVITDNGVSWRNPAANNTPPNTHTAIPA